MYHHTQLFTCVLGIRTQGPHACVASVLQTEGHFGETLQAGRLMGSFMTTPRTDLNKTETMTGKTDNRAGMATGEARIVSLGPRIIR